MGAAHAANRTMLRSDPPFPAVPHIGDEGGGFVAFQVGVDRGVRVVPIEEYGGNQVVNARLLLLIEHLSPSAIEGAQRGIGGPVDDWVVQPGRVGSMRRNV